MTSFSRRDFLRASVGAACAGGILPSIMAPRAHAADTSGYKAMVCIFSFGGTDNNDVIIPRDTASYQLYANTRQSLLNAYGADANAASRLRDDLIPIIPTNSEAFAGREFGVAAEYAPMIDLFDRGECAIVGGVGPLIQPVTRAQFEARSVPLPKQLFSHNDQQSTWMALDTEGSRVGWGGRFIDRFKAVDSGFRSDIAGVSTTGNSVLLAGGASAAFSLGSGGPTNLAVTERLGLIGGNSQFDATRDLLRTYLSTERGRALNVFANDYEALTSAGVRLSDEVDGYFDELRPLTTNFNETPLEGQLKVVAEMIALRDVVRVPRQVFFVGIGGFDTHSTQASDLPPLHRQIANGIRNFRDAMVELGVWQDVTVFTAADFGRTLNDNGDGTDHGWAGHHFVAGGSVRGQRVYGGFPDSDINSGAYTDSRGRLIPDVSVEQYASTLGGWFGLTPAERRAALPNLANFNTDDLGFMQI